VTARRTALLLLILATVTCAAWGQENLALGRPYTLVPGPSYAYCSDEGDLTQLTDGAFVGPEQFWIQAGCVGWKLPVDGDADVVIDLGAVHALDTIRFRTSSGPNADVYLPSGVFAVSDDGETFHLVAHVDTWGDEQLSRRWVSAENLRTRGRFVLVRLRANGVYAFTDEIEVMAGAHDPAAVTLPGETLEPQVQEVVLTPLQRRLVRDLTGLRAALSGLPDGTGDELRRRTREAESLTAALEEVTGAQAEAAEAAVAGVHTDVLRAVRGERSLVAWPVAPYALASPRDLPPARPARPIRVTLARHAHAAAAIDIANLGDESVNVRVAAEQLDDLVRLREARFIPTRQGNLLADALPLLDDGEITIPARQTRQLWLSVASGEAEPGAYAGAVSIAGCQPDRIPVTVTVAPARIPDDLPYSTYSWQYPDTWPALQGIEDAAVADLVAHHTNVTILTAGSAPWPAEVDEQGNLTAPMDFAQHDRMVELCRPMSAHGIAWFVNLAHGRRGFDQFERMSPPYRRLFGQWMTAWVEHLRGLGIGHDRFLFYPIDESIDEVYVEIARLTREVDPRVRLFADPLARDSDERLRQVLPLVDVWCPYLTMYERRPWQLDMIRDTGATVWSYLVGRREAPPYAHYRLHHWRAWREGATGAGFWCYAQGGDWQDADLWDDFSGGNADYGVIYTLTGAPDDISRAEAIIPGKRWEAWREGVEDWLYLWLFDRAIAGRADEAAQRAWLAQAVAEVLDGADDPARADAARSEILARLATM